MRISTRVRKGASYIRARARGSLSERKKPRIRSAKFYRGMEGKSEKKREGVGEERVYKDVKGLLKCARCSAAQYSGFIWAASLVNLRIVPGFQCAD